VYDFHHPTTEPPMRSLAVLLFVAVPLLAADPAHPVFKEGKHKGGELKLVDGVPLTVTTGTPEEIGEQLGELIGKNATDPKPVLDDFLDAVKLKSTMPVMKRLSGGLKGSFPADHLTEMEALAKHAGYDADLLPVCNTIYDLSSSFMGCSTLVLDKTRTADGKVLFGRLFDWVPSKGLPERSVVIVCKPKGKRAFASVTLAPITGVISGMNDAGLCVTLNEIALKSAKDKSKFDWQGVPTLFVFRRVLEECETVAEAEKLVRDMKHTTTACMTVVDAKGGAVFEISPKSVEVRTPTGGMLACTNTFVSDGLGTATKPCPRLTKLNEAEKADDKLSVKDVFARLDGVNQKKATIQAMVFEPADKKLHLKITDGKESATKSKAVVIEPFK
jgi:isopenicillin-N N-acyltransferase like protein